jgi:hypothetical protein
VTFPLAHSGSMWMRMRGIVRLTRGMTMPLSRRVRGPRRNLMVVTRMGGDLVHMEKRRGSDSQDESASCLHVCSFGW